ncbi:hypothetical protein QYE76_069879 [Lolium multiflorum]|uniref:Peptidase C1A papain C-terminal domain-containing protein n=1 Tax=Lolium multiflorum TaxID=4521 RepID=A0AAD8SI60_LOLMU|nr:hypothetical protein QYE76_069879 [Lolium multiflorum]
MMTSGVAGFNTSAVDVPSSVDWRDALPPVKNQRECGACWAFGTVAAVEALHSIQNGWRLSLSEQQLVDCERIDEDGCHSGHVGLALQWIIKNGGITGEEDYPYTGVRGSCDSDKLGHFGATVTGYGLVETCNEQALMLAVAAQPVIVSMEGSGKGFKEYRGGVFEGPCGTTQDHTVLLVGYGRDDVGPYWIARNSWGGQWGEDGWYDLDANAPCSELMCGVLDTRIKLRLQVWKVSAASKAPKARPLHRWARPLPAVESGGWLQRRPAAPRLQRVLGATPAANSSRIRRSSSRPLPASGDSSELLNHILGVVARVGAFFLRHPHPRLLDGDIEGVALGGGGIGTPPALSRHPPPGGLVSGGQGYPALWRRNRLVTVTPPSSRVAPARATPEDPPPHLSLPRCIPRRTPGVPAQVPVKVAARLPSPRLVAGTQDLGGGALRRALWRAALVAVLNLAGGEAAAGIDGGVAPSASRSEAGWFGPATSTPSGAGFLLGGAVVTPRSTPTHLLDESPKSLRLGGVDALRHGLHGGVTWGDSGFGSGVEGGSFGPFGHYP